LQSCWWHASRASLLLTTRWQTGVGECRAVTAFSSSTAPTDSWHNWQCSLRCVVMVLRSCDVIHLVHAVLLQCLLAFVCRNAVAVADVARALDRFQSAALRMNFMQVGTAQRSKDNLPCIVAAAAATGPCKRIHSG
jgi:hypothetical protein